MDKYEKQLIDIAEADQSEYKRLVVENEQLKLDLRVLRERYGFPLNHMKQAIQWMDKQLEKWRENPDQPNRFEVLQKEIRELAVKYGIRKEWKVVLLYSAILGDNSPIGPSYNMGFPEERWYSDGQQEIIITDKTALDNPYVIDFIKHSQRHDRDKPPQPQPMKSNPRKLDWRSVWEWKKRYPDVTHEMIAEMLGYHPDTIRKKLSEVAGDK